MRLCIVRPCVLVYTERGRRRKGEKGGGGRRNGGREAGETFAL